jgi:Rps23 Pro-64 3,4-dihydroxylase Tpa1-like proline 4-hydroxylase
MTDLDYIKVYDDVLDLGQCNHYINLIKLADKKAGNIFKNNGQIGTDRSIKYSEDVCFSQIYPEEIPNLLQLFSDYSNVYETDIKIKAPIKNADPIMGRVYKKNIGFYKPHIDSGSPGNSFRCMTLILYLNTVEVGGELVFPHQGKNIKALAGRLIIFPSSWMYLHGANTPLSSDRYIIRTFFNSN